nr:hypothetical transcript [Hymenolepis microstoma]
MGSPFLVKKEGPTCKESERNEKYEFFQLLITSGCSLLSNSTNYVPILFGYHAEIRLTRFAFTLHAQRHGLFTNRLNLPLVAHAFGPFGEEETVCELPRPCRGSYIKCGKNSTSGQCDPFVYGGCGGNENELGREEECELTDIHV